MKQIFFSAFTELAIILLLVPAEVVVAQSVDQKLELSENVKANQSESKTAHQEPLLVENKENKYWSLATSCG